MSHSSSGPDHLPNASFGLFAVCRCLGPLSGDQLVKIKVRCGIASSEAGPPAEGQILKCPMDENEDAALKLDDVHQMDERPNQPGKEAGEIDAEDFGDGSCTPDHGQTSFVKVLEGL